MRTTLSLFFSVPLILVIVALHPTILCAQGDYSLSDVLHNHKNNLINKRTWPSVKSIRLIGEIIDRENNEIEFTYLLKKNPRNENNSFFMRKSLRFPATEKRNYETKFVGIYDGNNYWKILNNINEAYLIKEKMSAKDCAHFQHEPFLYPVLLNLMDTVEREYFHLESNPNPNLPLVLKISDPKSSTEYEFELDKQKFLIEKCTIRNTYLEKEYIFRDYAFAESHKFPSIIEINDLKTNSWNKVFIHSINLNLGISNRIFNKDSVYDIN